MAIRVTIIEDDAATRQFLAAWIRDSQKFLLCGVHCDGPSAVTSIPSEKPDVALVDINLPGLDGVSIVHELKPLLPATEFLMLTVYNDAEQIFKALQAGASGYLLKQTPRDKLLAALEDVYNGGSPLNSQVARHVLQSFWRAPAEQGAEPLSEREETVLNMLARGCLYKEIADTLGISLGTVNTYVRRTYDKLRVHSRAQAVAKCLERRAR